MKSRSDLFNELIGCTLTKVYHNTRSEPSEPIEGLGLVDYFNVIIELEGIGRFYLGIEHISQWTENEELTEITNENWNVPTNIIFNNRTIKDILFNHFGQIYIRLDNHVILEFRCDHGCSLDIENYNAVYDDNGKALWDQN